MKEWWLLVIAVQMIRPMIYLNWELGPIQKFLSTYHTRRWDISLNFRPPSGMAVSRSYPRHFFPFCEKKKRKAFCLLFSSFLLSFAPFFINMFSSGTGGFDWEFACGFDGGLDWGLDRGLDRRLDRGLDRVLDRGFDPGLWPGALNQGPLNPGPLNPGLYTHAFTPGALKLGL